jgi:hypothetical protein
MFWKPVLPAALAVCVLLLAGSAGCAGADAREQGKNGVSSSPVGRLLDVSDGEGRHFREVDEEGAPAVGVEVKPDAGGSWDVRLTFHNFRFSPPGAKAEAVAGRGLVHLFVDGRLVSELRKPLCRLPADLVPRGTHHVTARLYADDGTVWAVDGEAVESTADITASETETSAAPTPGGTPAATPTGTTSGLSTSGDRPRTGGQGSPRSAGKAS